MLRGMADRKRQSAEHTDVVPFKTQGVMTMSHEQRERINAELGRPAVAASADRSIETIRAGFAAFMSTMRVPPGTRSSITSLGGRRTLLVEAEQQLRTGTTLYFHGGSFLMDRQRPEWR